MWSALPVLMWVERLTAAGTGEHVFTSPYAHDNYLFGEDVKQCS